MCPQDERHLLLAAAQQAEQQDEEGGGDATKEKRSSRRHLRLSQRVTSRAVDEETASLRNLVRAAVKYYSSLPPLPKNK